jgi:Ni/Fe-hydrogenase 1 B-type cytochrome subunit
MFMGNQWSHWDQFIPTTKKRLKDLVETARYYGFMTWSPTPHIGHNAMAGAAYAAVFAMAFVEILTGLALYSRVLGSMRTSSGSSTCRLSSADSSRSTCWKRS